MRILAFIGFLVAYFAWIWASTAWMKRTKRDILANKTFLTGQISILLNLVVLFGFVFILSGYFDWRLVAAFWGAFQIGVVLTAIFGGFLISPASRWGARGIFAGGEFGMKHVPLTLAIMFGSLLLIIAYPIATGISYFGLPPPALPTRLFQYAIVLVLAGSLMLLWFTVGSLVSENLDEDTRTRFLVTQFSALVPTALLLALLFWSFGVAGAGQEISLDNVSLHLSPVLIGLLIAFFLLTMVIPYFIGAQRAKRWRTTLAEKRIEWMAKLLDVLETPSSAVYLPRLAALQAELASEIEEFESNDPMIAAANEIDRGIVRSGMEEIAPAYQLARPHDPRFSHLDWLRQLQERIGEIQAHLSGLQTEPELEKAGGEWTKFLRPREAELNKERGETGKTRTPAMLILSGVFVPIFTIFLSEFAKWLWAFFSGSVLQ